MADFGTRFSAFVIDTALLFVAQWLVFIVASRQLQAVGMTKVEACGVDPTETCDGPSDLLWVFLIAILVVSTIGYYAWFEGVHGATPGKRWMGLAVTRTDGTSPIGLETGFVRAMVRQSFWLSLFFLLDVSPLSIVFPSALFVAIPLLAIGGVAFGAVNPSGRSLHDMAAMTQVVRADAVGQTSAASRPAAASTPVDGRPLPEESSR
jgi:uncharacterized RDD family membrane protein YckC